MASATEVAEATDQVLLAVAPGAIDKLDALKVPLNPAGRVCARLKFDVVHAAELWFVTLTV